MANYLFRDKQVIRIDLALPDLTEEAKHPLDFGYLMVLNTGCDDPFDSNQQKGKQDHVTDDEG